MREFIRRVDRGIGMLIIGILSVVIGMMRTVLRSVSALRDEFDPKSPKVQTRYAADFYEPDDDHYVGVMVTGYQVEGLEMQKFVEDRLRQIVEFAKTAEICYRYDRDRDAQVHEEKLQAIVAGSGN